MPYDNLKLKDFSGYFEAKEPGRRQRADAWATAIGLQQVDGLSPSEFLIATAKEHIEGRITQGQARRRIHDYYAVKDANCRPDPEKEEPDKVSERIAAVINENGFEFTPEYYISIHQKLFRGVLPTAGKLRTINIVKPEWVLKEESVTYGSKDTLMSSLIRDFQDELTFDYGDKSPCEIIPHFVRFIAQIWQVHPFMEGNSRTTAVFSIKYLHSLGYQVSNNMFHENSWYFRNALVRANYANYARGVKREWGYLEAFFRNLLLGEHNELKSRYLQIGLDREVPQFRNGDGSRQVVRKGCQKKVVRNSQGNTTERLFKLLKCQPQLTQIGMAAALGISRQAIQKHLGKLKSAGRLLRIGPDKGGHWEVR